MIIIEQARRSTYSSGEKAAIKNILIKMLRFAKFLNNLKVPLLWELGHYLIDNLILKICMFVAIDKDEEGAIFTNKFRNRTKDFPALYKDILATYYSTIPDYENEIKDHHLRRNVFQHSETSLKESMRQELVEPYLDIVEKIMKITNIITNDTEISPLNLFEERLVDSKVILEQRDPRIDEFIQERYTLIAKNKTYLIKDAKTKTVVHLIPENAFKIKSSFDLSKINDRKYLKPIHCIKSIFPNYNIDGLRYLCGVNETNIESYTQIYKNGIIEAVSGTLILPRRYVSTGKIILWLNISHFEGELIRAVIRYKNALEQLRVKLPLYISVKLFDIKDYFISTSTRGFDEPSRTIEQNTIRLGEIILDKYEKTISTLMRPLFDTLWNAFGFPHSSSYDEDGLYKYESTL